MTAESTPAPVVLAAIVADVAQGSVVPASEVTIERVEAVTWRDGSLGCPEPGVA